MVTMTVDNGAQAPRRLRWEGAFRTPHGGAVLAREDTRAPPHRRGDGKADCGLRPSVTILVRALSLNLIAGSKRSPLPGVQPSMSDRPKVIIDAATRQLVS